MKRIILLSGIFLFGVILFACAPKIAPVEKPTEVAMPIAKEDWEVEWEKTLAEARKEGKVVLYGGDVAGELSRELRSAFYDKFGIVVEITGGRGALLTERIARERKAGLFLADLNTGGLGTSLFYTFKPGGMVEPIEQFLILPEVKNPKYWWNGRRFNDKDRTALVFQAYVVHGIAINTDLVKREELKSYRDLLQLKWKGKILMNDPIPPGTARRWIGFVVKVLGIDYLKALGRQEPTIIRDERLHTEWLARGKFPIATTPLSGSFTEFQKAGAPIKRIEMTEGAHVTAGMGVIVFMNKAPHPNAAKIFLNWLLTKEGQTIFSRVVGTQSARLDVPTDFLEPDVIRKEGVKYLDQNNEEYILQEPQFLEIAKEIFGPLLK